jgi:phospho-N-acetylmuramoyl-pentapeptide-transferase
MMGGPALVGALMFLALVPAGKAMIGWLQTRGIRKRIRADGPASHMVKAGTPTMGGLLFVGAAVLAGIVMLLLGPSEILWPVISVVAFAALGGVDDLKGLKDVQGVGWLARLKFPWQWLMGLVLAAGMYLTGAFAPIGLPFTEQVLDLGIWFVPVGAFLIVGWVNAANLADGLDGLAAGMGSLIVALLAILGVSDGHSALGFWSAALLGGLLAFLWHNAHPARVFMGDVGAEALGAALATIALVSGNMIPLLVAGAAMLSEALSVMIQVGYFKYTRRRFGEGRRVFRMAPLHHHFEQLGGDEVQITQRFWIVTAVLALLALALEGAF